MKLLNSLFQRQIVQHYSTKAKQINLDFTLGTLKCHKDDQHKIEGLDMEVEVPPFACSFNKTLLKGHMLAVADEDGSVCLFDLRKQGPSSKLKGWVAHSNAIFDIAWMHDEPKLITASGDQTAQLWDIQHGTRLAVFRGHSCSLKSVDFQEENLFVFATGARDGNVMIWDVRCNKRDGYYQPVNTIRNCHSTMPSTTPQRTKKRGRRPLTVVSQDSQQSVTSVKFQDPSKIISAGAVDGNIKVWDLRKNYSTIRTEPVPYHVFPYPGSGTRKHGFSSLTLDSHKSKLFANCTNDVIYMYDCIAYSNSPLASFQGHSNATFYVKSAVSPDDQFLMSGSGDCDGYIWKISEPDAPPFHLKGHVGEVTSVAWCPQDQGKAVTCSDDNNLKVWRVNFEEKDTGEFVGWCERKPCSNVLSKQKDNLPSMIRTPTTSPSRSCNSFSSNSPVSLSPNPTKCSPQQFLKSWLNSNNNNNNNNNNKRPRESDSAVVTRNKRYCLEDRLQSDETSNSDISENNENSCPSTSIGEEIVSKNEPNQATSEISHKPEETIKFEGNKENIRINRRTDNSETDNGLSEIIRTSSEKNKFGQTVVKSHQRNCKNVKEDKRKLNWLSEMGVKSKTGNCQRLKGNENEQGCKKEKASSQPSSPLLSLPEPSSPDKELAAVLKSMRCIRAYFKPIPESDEDSPSKYCER